MMLIGVSIEEVAGTHYDIHIPMSVDHPTITAQKACCQGRVPLYTAVFSILPIVIQPQLWPEEEVLEQLPFEPETIVKLYARPIHFLDPAVTHRHHTRDTDALIVIHSQVHAYISALRSPHYKVTVNHNSLRQRTLSPTYTQQHRQHRHYSNCSSHFSHYVIVAAKFGSSAFPSAAIMVRSVFPSAAIMVRSVFPSAAVLGCLLPRLVWRDVIAPTCL